MTLARFNTFRLLPETALHAFQSRRLRQPCKCLVDSFWVGGLVGFSDVDGPIGWTWRRDQWHFGVLLGPIIQVKS